MPVAQGQRDDQPAPRGRLRVLPPWTLPMTGTRGSGAQPAAKHQPPSPGSRSSAREFRGTVLIAALAAWDMAGVFLALLLTGAFHDRATDAVVGIGLALVAAIILKAAGAYRPAAWGREHPIETLGALTVAATGIAWAAVVLSAVSAHRTDAGALVVVWLVLPFIWYAGRRAATVAWRRRRPERILIVGGGEIAARVVRLTRRRAGVLIGCLDDDAGAAHGAPVLGTLEDLPRVLSEHAVDRVIIAFSSRRDYETLEALRGSTNFHGSVDIVPRFFDYLGPTATMYTADGLPLLSVPERRISAGRRVAKRAIDLVGACVLLVVLSPVLCLIALAIVLESGRPVLFRQRRIGLHGRSFLIVKFRTLVPLEGDPPALPALELTPESIAMHVERAKQEAVQRATRLGAFLRKTSLDELPQLINVLKGDMSLVGPRPLSPLEDAALDGWERLRREVRPGITGLWQVSGRSEVSWEERLNLDYRQVRHWSLYSDIQVLADTVSAVIRQRGAE
jgi:exopolysaccharide biosynthesis polyprenyl glycosylphosphotransferase